jgi:glycosyltransferase involved in cell wall biosynthesis
VSQATKDDLVKFYDADARKVTVVQHGVGNEANPKLQDPNIQSQIKNQVTIFNDPGLARVVERLERDSPSRSLPRRPRQERGAGQLDDARRLGLPQRYVIAIGTVQPRKNYGRLIEAFASLGLPRSETALVIVGRPGWNSAAIESQAAQAGVILAGHVPDDEKAALLAGASAYALPSLYEGFGMPILEAQAAGVPVITSSTSSCPEVAGDGALLVDPLDTQAIARAIRRVLDDEPLRRTLIDRGFANAAKFSWERCARETLSVLEEAYAERALAG